MQTIVRAKVTQGGRIVIPVEMRNKLGIEIGEEVNITLEEGSLSVSTSKQALERLRLKVRPKNGAKRSVVDEFIADRRKEAENE